MTNLMRDNLLDTKQPPRSERLTHRLDARARAAEAKVKRENHEEARFWRTNEGNLLPGARKALVGHVGCTMIKTCTEGQAGSDAKCHVAR